MTQTTNSTSSSTNNYSWSSPFYKAGNALAYPVHALAQGVAAIAPNAIKQANLTPGDLGIRPPSPARLITSLSEARELTEEQRKIFVRRMSAYSTFKAVYESVCGMPTPPPEALLYEKILDQTNHLTQKDFDRYARKHFFAVLEETPLNFFQKLFARLTYYFIVPEISYIIDTISKRVLCDVRETLDQQCIRDKCEMIGNHNLGNISDYLKELTEIYQELQTSSATGNIDDAIESKLKERLIKLGYTQEQINHDFITQFLKDYPITYSFNEIIHRFLTQFRFSKPSPFHFMNPALGLFYTVVYVALWLLLVAPQRILAYVLPDKVANIALPQRWLDKGVRYGFENFVSKNDLIGLTMENVLETVKHKEYSYTINSNLTELLSDLCYVIQDHSDEVKPDSTVKLEHIAPIVKRLLTILGLSHVENIEDLKGLNTDAEHPFSNDPLTAQLVNRLIVFGAEKGFPDLFEQVVTPLEIEKLVLTSLGSMNRIFDIPPTITDEQIAAANLEIRAVKDKVIDLTVRELLKTLPPKALGIVGSLISYVANVNGIQSGITKVVHNAVKQRTDAIVDSFLLKPHHYSEGVFNRLVLLPYLKAEPRALAPKIRNVSLSQAMGIQQLPFGVQDKAVPFQAIHRLV